MTTLVAQPSLLVESQARQLGDASFGSQVDRWGSRPLTTDDDNLTKFGSFKGRGACLVNFVATPFREAYREGKNLLVLAEKVFNFVRVFFQCLFREGGYSWTDCRDRLKDVASSFAALFGRVVTVILDELKLGAGILYPAAAIKSTAASRNDQDTINDDDLDVNDDDDSTNNDEDTSGSNSILSEDGNLQLSVDGNLVTDDNESN